MSHKNVNFTPEKLRRLKVAREEAVQAKKDSFVLDGDEYDVGYAKYLIEFLEEKFGQPLRN